MELTLESVVNSTYSSKFVRGYNNRPHSKLDLDNHVHDGEVEQSFTSVMSSREVTPTSHVVPKIVTASLCNIFVAMGCSRTPTHRAIYRRSCRKDLLLVASRVNRLVQATVTKAPMNLLHVK